MHMPESIEAPNGNLLKKRDSSLTSRTLEPFRKMTTLTRTVGVFGIIAVTLLCYLCKGKCCKRRTRI